MLSQKRSFPADMDDMDDFLNRLEGEVKTRKFHSEGSPSTTHIQRQVYNQRNSETANNEEHHLFSRINESSFEPSFEVRSASPNFPVSNLERSEVTPILQHESPPMPSHNPEHVQDDSIPNKLLFPSMKLIGIENTAKNLQAAIYKILEEAPKYSDLKDYTSDDPEILKSKYFVLAAKLKEATEEGRLNVFNHIVEFSEDSVFQDSSDLRDEIKAPIEYVIFDSNNNQRQMVNINYDDYIDCVPPPLPVIKDDHLYDQVFAHKSLELSKYPDYIDETNERLIFLGESVMSNIVSRLFYKRFPELRDDFLVNERRELLSSTNLTKWSSLYSLDQQADSMVQYAKMKQKHYGECFYAYVGALSVQFGDDITVILRWIEALIEPAIQRLNLAEPINKSAKGELNLLIGSQSCTPSYHTIRTGDSMRHNFVVECRMGSDVLGEGEAPNLKDAQIRAAMAALKNLDLMDKYSRMNRLNPLSSSNRLMIEDGSRKMEDFQIQGSNLMVISDKFSNRPSLEVDLPIIAPVMDKSTIDLKSKERLYSLLQQSRKIPTYDMERVDDANMKLTLSVDGIPLVIAFERNKKISSQKAAQVLLANLGVLKSLNFL